MTKLIVGNWKMQKLFTDLLPYFEVFKQTKIYSGYKLGLAVPSLYLETCLKMARHTPFMIGAQDVSEHSFGAYTGEVCARQLASLGTQFSLAGHSERRAHFNESSELVIKKAQALQAQKLLSIVCLGESLEQKPHFKEVLSAQLKNIFSLNPDLLVIAYEPVWAIGTGKTPTTDEIGSVHKYIKSFLQKGSPDFTKVPVLYGGSVNAQNVSSIVEHENVDGVLVGGASLDPFEFEKLIAKLGT